MKRLIKKIKFELEFVLVKEHKVPISSFQNKPLEYLIKRCDRIAKDARETCNENERITNIKFEGYWALNIKEQIVMNSIKEAIRIADAEDSLNEYIKKKYQHNTDFIDIKVREAFRNKGIIASMIACSHGYNHYGIRNVIFNNNLTDVDCPRYNELEIQDYVIKYAKIRELQKEFIKDTTLETIKINKGKINEEEILDMIEDIVIYLQNGDPEEYETNQ